METRSPVAQVKAFLHFIAASSYVTRTAPARHNPDLFLFQTGSYGQFRILDLDAIIAAKEAVARDKDKAAVKQLRAIKERQQAGH